ncbi:MAG: extensin family protein [Pseudomonadota bacterium]
MARFLAGFFGLLVTLSLVLGGLVIALVYVPNSPLPDEWNPRTPLEMRAPFTPVTDWKLRQRIENFEYCQKFLTELDVTYTVLPPKEVDAFCHIRNQVEVTQLSQSKINTLRTTCSTALRLALWEYHGLQNAAQRHFQTNVASLSHIGSYSCRKIRTTEGDSDRFSEHATANAVDISGVTLGDGRKIDLITKWQTDMGFLHEIRDQACTYYRAVLSPDFNDLHADHFHMDMGRWRTCR